MACFPKVSEHYFQIPFLSLLFSITKLSWWDRMTNNPGPVPISMHQNGFLEECTSDDGISSNQCLLCISIKLNFFLIFCLAIPLGYMCLWIDPPVKRTNNKNLCFPTFTEHHLFFKLERLNNMLFIHFLHFLFLQYFEDFAQKLYLLQNSGQFGWKQHSLAAGRVTRWSLWYWYLDVYVDHLYFQIQVTEKYSTAMLHSLAAGRVTDEKFDRELSIGVTLAMERTFTVNIFYLIRYIQNILIRTFIVNIVHLIIEGLNGPGWLLWKVAADKGLRRQRVHFVIFHCKHFPTDCRATGCKIYNITNKFWRLCLLEKQHIMLRPGVATLDKRIFHHAGIGGSSPWQPWSKNPKTDFPARKHNDYLFLTKFVFDSWVMRRNPKLAINRHFIRWHKIHKDDAMPRRKNTFWSDSVGFSHWSNIWRRLQWRDICFQVEKFSFWVPNYSDLKYSQSKGGGK